MNQSEQGWEFAAWSSEGSPSTPFILSRNAVSQENGT